MPPSHPTAQVSHHGPCAREKSKAAKVEMLNFAEITAVRPHNVRDVSALAILAACMGKLSYHPTEGTRPKPGSAPPKGPALHFGVARLRQDW